MPEATISVRLVLDVRRHVLRGVAPALETLRVLEDAPPGALVVLRVDRGALPDQRVVEQLRAAGVRVDLRAPDGHTARLWHGALTGALVGPLWDAS